MDSQKPTQNLIDEPWDELDEWICQLPMLEPSSGFNARVMSRIDRSLYGKPQQAQQKYHGGHILVLLGVLAIIQSLTIDTLQWIFGQLIELLPRIPLLESMNTVYHAVVYRMVYYVFIPYRMMMDFTMRLSQGNQLWYAVGIFNLLLLLLLVHFSIRRMISNSREEG